MQPSGGNVRDAEILRLTKIDPHSLGRWRVDGAVPHVDAWYDAFNITSSDPLWLPKEKRHPFGKISRHHHINESTHQQICFQEL